MKCTKCGTEFEPTPSLLSRRWYRCLDCRRPVMDRHRVKPKPETLARRTARYAADPIQRLKQLARAKVRAEINAGRLMPKPCSKCNAAKADAHHIDYSKPLEVDWLCRSCHRQAHPNIRQSHCPVRALETRRKAARNREHRRWRDPEQRVKVAARSILRWAVFKGQVTKEPCAKCGDTKVQAHHTDYAKPFAVIWLCRLCHMQEHRSSQ